MTQGNNRISERSPGQKQDMKGLGEERDWGT
ncbi:hypothetical protein T4D_4629 [Trichinella pseudospiralis]|uniref:Uncharacterized protein n=1 Tax=Trichinella pseudospiralis TaxID=6337 RepID=A0A0V1DPV5_TRIPS|nr:hypothetical protein T4D_4629 [Trichinella pseudospiralis]